MVSHQQPPAAIVALGSNLGDSCELLLRAMRLLGTCSDHPVRTSSLWRSAPVDCPPGSPDFINAAALLVPRAGETPESLLDQLQVIEREFGRQPKRVLNEPRPLDLDMIVFGAERRSTDRLTLPHPRAHLRRFVLLPLEELAPALVLPGQRLTVSELLCRLGEDQQVARVERRAQASNNMRTLSQSAGRLPSGTGTPTP